MTKLMSRWQFAAWTLCVAGALARIAAYAQNRSLWYDEAALALNLARRGYMGLLAPLDNLQTAPPAFLWIERAAAVAFGFNEWSLRALPLAAGIATGPMMWRVARKMLPPPAALLAVALVTLSPSLVRYSAEVKPYGLDALVTLVLLDRAIAASEPTARRSQWWLLAALGIVAAASSTPAPFVLAGVIAFFTVRATMMRDALLARRVATLTVGWGLTIVLLVATVFRPLLGRDAGIGKFMHWYWASNFLTPGPPGLATKVSVMLWVAFTNTFFGAAALPGSTTLLVATVAVGCLMLIASRKFAELALVVVPIATLVIASALRVYPIAERLVLFVAPLSAVMLASSLLLFVRQDGAVRNAWLGALSTAIVAMIALRGVAAFLASDDGKEETRALVRGAVREHASGTPVWVSGGGEAAWRFYSGQIGSPTRTAETGPLAPVNRSIAPDVLVGAWYNNTPERIVPTPADTAADATPSVWSNSEALRIRAVARPCALLLLSQTKPGEAASLLNSAVLLGGRVVQSWRAPGAALHEVCFAASGSDPFQ